VFYRKYSSESAKPCSIVQKRWKEGGTPWLGITLANWLVHGKEFMGHTNTCIFRAELAAGPQNMKTKDIGDIIATLIKKSYFPHM
jgi:hypothetical protein